MAMDRPVWAGAADRGRRPGSDSLWYCRDAGRAARATAPGQARDSVGHPEMCLEDLIAHYARIVTLIDGGALSAPGRAPSLGRAVHPGADNYATCIHQNVILL
jgi:hypothetical protein